MSAGKTNPNFSIERLKRDAKRLKVDRGIKLGMAQDLIAAQHGFANWSMLARSISAKQVNSTSTNAAKLPPTTFRDALSRYVTDASDEVIEAMHRGSGVTVWIHEDDLTAGDFGRMKFLSGRGLENRVRHPEQPWYLKVMSTEGIDESLVFEDDDTLDVDEEGNVIVPRGSTLFTADVARQDLLALIGSGHFDSEPEALEAMIRDDANA